MSFYLALSSLQGQDQLEAYNSLAELNPDDFQLTPGNKVNCKFKESISLPYRLEETQSIHPPIPSKYAKDFKYWIDNVAADHIKTMEGLIAIVI